MRNPLRIATSFALVLLAGFSVWGSLGDGKAASPPVPAPPSFARPQEQASPDDALHRHAPPAGTAAQPAINEPSQQQHLLDELFSRLAKSADPAEAQGIAGAIQRVWMRSGSDTADLLMNRALSAVQGKQLPLAERLLTSVIGVEPEWAEAWNKRATVRFMNNDDFGAMEDIAQVLQREPRHFGALIGMGTILERAGLKKAALKVFRKALEIYPEQEDLRKMVDKLTLDVEGRDI